MADPCGNRLRAFLRQIPLARGLGFTSAHAAVSGASYPIAETRVGLADGDERRHAMNNANAHTSVNVAELRACTVIER